MKMKQEDLKRILVCMPKTLYQHIVKAQYNVFKTEHKRISIASLVRNALEKTYVDKKETT